MPNSYLTTSQAAELLGIDANKVTRWINSGQLTAINIAQSISGRPRWRISQEELDQFLIRRQSSPPPQVRRRRRNQAGVIQFY